MSHHDDVKKLEINDPKAFFLEASREHALVVFIYNGMCGWCRLMMPHWNAAVKRWQEGGEGNSRVLMAQVSGPHHRDMVQRLEVKGYPSFFIVDRGGCADEAVLATLRTQMAPRTEQAILQFMDEVAKRPANQAAPTASAAASPSTAVANHVGAEWIALEGWKGPPLTGHAHPHAHEHTVHPAQPQSERPAATIPLPPTQPPDRIASANTLFLNKMTKPFSITLSRKRQWKLTDVVKRLTV